MTIDIIIISCLVIVMILLLITIRKTNIKSDNNFDIDIKQINKNLENLYNKALEQTGYVNSKIEEIGTLTKKMSNAMSTNISDMGEMGEVILENILQDCGMTKDRDYKTQFTDKNENGQIFRPDVVVFLPENRNIVIDSKVPMKDWYEFQNSNDEQSKVNSMKGFINSLKNHINNVHKKDYTNLLNVNSPDYVFIFMPHEFALITAQKYDQSISNYAQQRQIIVVGPSTLIMCMKLVESIWRLEKQNKNSKEVAEIAGGMFDQIAKTLNLLDKTEASMIKSAENINQTKKYIKDGKGSLLSRANKMKELGAKTKIDLEFKE
jgi:DNA recombination protein RmuC